MKSTVRCFRCKAGIANRLTQSERQISYLGSQSDVRTVMHCAMLSRVKLNWSVSYTTCQTVYILVSTENSIVYNSPQIHDI